MQSRMGSPVERAIRGNQHVIKAKVVQWKPSEGPSKCADRASLAAQVRSPSEAIRGAINETDRASLAAQVRSRTRAVPGVSALRATPRRRARRSTRPRNPIRRPRDRPRLRAAHLGSISSPRGTARCAGCARRCRDPSALMREAIRMQSVCNQHAISMQPVSRSIGP